MKVVAIKSFIWGNIKAFKGDTLTVDAVEAKILMERRFVEVGFDAEPFDAEGEDTPDDEL